MLTKHLWTMAITLGCLVSGGCSSSTSGSRDGSTGTGGAGRDGGVGGSGGNLGTVDASTSSPGTGGRGTGGAGTGGTGTGGAGAGGVGGIVGTGGVGTGGARTGGSVGAGGGAIAGRDGGLGGVGTGGAGFGGADASIAGAGGRDASLGGVDGGGAGGLDGGGATGTGGASAGNVDGGCGALATMPAVTRGGKYFSFTEKFNRYYTDCAWQPSSTVYVSPTGTGNGSSATSAAGVATALAAVVPGSLVVFTAGTYAGCYELDSDHSGTYDNPIVLAGERKSDGSPGVTINCCSSGRKTCINLEAADYVAVDGFELVGGDYGLRSVGAGYPANEHQKGVAVLNNIGHGQNKDPFFTGQSDWFVIERCTGHDSGSGDGHGIYLSNGSDWNIARGNETYNTVSSDFQINADPISSCSDDGVAYDDPECDAVAGSSTTGGRGASDFMLIDSNFFHHSQAQGPNFTSVRNSTIKNNIFALPATHGASFWQETDNPKLGASNNLVAHNLFIVQVNDREAIGVIDSSTGNQFKNNVVVAVSISGSAVSANAKGQLLATDSTTVQANTFENNAWISGYFGSNDSSAAYTPNATEHQFTNFAPTWFAAFPTTLGHDPAAFAPTATAPWLNLGSLLPEVPTDFTGKARQAPVDLGPFER
jgi:hypothetical protein